jgi:very-short-patch-repair endonuclease
MKPKKDWRQELYHAADTYYAAERDEAIDGLSQWIETACESPIERLLVAQLAFIRVYGSAPAVWPRWLAPNSEVVPGAALDASTITLQHELLSYRVDAALWFRNYQGELIGLVIECDGHDYHERTKKQAARDRSRDRELLTAGYYVMRFTGAEIYADPAKCARQVEDMVQRIIQESARRLNG